MQVCCTARHFASRARNVFLVFTQRFPTPPFNTRDPTHWRAVFSVRPKLSSILADAQAKALQLLLMVVVGAEEAEGAAMGAAAVVTAEAVVVVVTAEAAARAAELAAVWGHRLHGTARIGHRCPKRHVRSRSL